jgi:5-formyltetrahydrofolate cyclo-ligase
MDSGTNKAALRRQALTRRALVSPDQRAAAAEHIAAEGLRLARARPGVRTAALYWPIRDEADTFPLIRALADAGFTTALPVVKGLGEPMAFRRWAPGDALVKAAYGLSEPDPGQPLVEPDIVFVPLAGFDRRGHRIGYGKGHYDVTLANLRAGRQTLVVGVAFSCQETPEIPNENHDQKLDFVITENDLIDFG